uniref:Glycosyltransferase family 92 protein n=1 Tax=Parascaris univalens TaxID=6257 RepID=A0A915AP40_PARUN
MRFIDCIQFIFSCKIPESVSIDEIQDWILTDGSNSAILQATYRIRREESIRAHNYDYSIYLPFVYGSMYEGKHLAEFAELNKLLGAQRITLYTLKNSLAKSLQKALDYYTEESICLPFLYGSMYEGKHLAEFAELNKLLGAQRITLYTLKNSLAKSLQKALDYYTEERLIEVIEYDLPVKDIWYHGQLITVTDCLYR